MSTPSRKFKSEELEGEMNDEVESWKATMFRAIAARANYLGQDRSDIRYAVKALCRSMSKQRQRDIEAFCRLGKYFKGRQRWIQKYDYQESTARDSNKYVNVWTDTDYAGCLIDNQKVHKWSSHNAAQPHHQNMERDTRHNSAIVRRG